MARNEPTSRGEVDHPRPGHVVDDGRLVISGWAQFDDGPVARIEASLDGQPLGRARLGLPRPDISAAFPGIDAAVAGFELRAGIGEELSGERELSVVAVSARGERHSFTTVPILLRPEGSRPPLLRARPRGPSGTGRRVLAFTNMLGLGGAATYLFDVLTTCRRLELLDPTVVTTIDGPLRGELEALGIPTHILSSVSLHEMDAYLDRIDELEAWAAPQGFEAVIVNTASGLSLPGADLAERLGLPAVWTIHESFHNSLLWEEMAPELRAHARERLAHASFAIFEAEATRELYLDSLRCPSEAIPYGLDLSPIDAVRTGFDRAAERERSGIPNEAQLAICVGTVEPRKAQVQLLQAFELIAGRHPEARLAFVGSDDGLDSTSLEARIERSPEGVRAQMVPRTPEVQRWYGMADLLVCASDIESLPRTVLEAMAWETPVLATSIFGLPELIVDGVSGWLCEAGDVRLLGEGLDRALSAGAEQRASIGAAGLELVRERHDMDRYANIFAGRIGALAA